MTILDRHFLNNFSTTTTSAIGQGDASVNVADASPLNIPAGKHVVATITQGATVEIVSITGKAGNVLSVERGQEGTFASAFSAGAELSVRLTAGTLTAIIDALRLLMEEPSPPPPPAGDNWGDITTTSFVTSYSTSAGAMFGWKMAFRPDGTRFYIGLTDAIAEFSLSTAWDLATASFTASRTVPGGYGFFEGFCFSADGTRLYTTPGDRVRQFGMSTAWDLTTLSYVGQTPEIWQAVGNIKEIRINSAGTVLFAATDWNNTDGNDTVYALPISTAWDITTLSTSYASRYTTADYQHYAFHMSSDASEFLWAGKNASDNALSIAHYSMGTAGDLSTVTLIGKANGVPSSSGDVTGLSAGGGFLLVHHADAVKVFSW